MIASSTPVEVAAILDWEMSTLGDPLADLGYFLVTYTDRAHPRTVMDLTPVTAGKGSSPVPNSPIVTSRRRASICPGCPGTKAFALWKAAIFSEAIYTRWLNGEAPSAGDFTGSLETGVPELIAAAEAIAATVV